MTLNFLNQKAITPDLNNQVNVLYRELNADIEQRSMSELLQAPVPAHIAIAMDNEKLAGIAIMATYTVISGHKGMIEDVVVSHNYRGKGIGRKLMELLLERANAEKLNDVLLFSGHHRAAAISLYKSLGFRLKDSGLYIKKLN